MYQCRRVMRTRKELNWIIKKQKGQLKFKEFMKKSWFEFMVYLVEKV